MKRGEIWWVRFVHARGGEQKKARPAVIVSNDFSNSRLDRVQVVPLTSSTERVFATEAIVRVRRKKSKAMAHQINTVSKTRVLNRVGRATRSEMKQLDRAIRIQLGLLS